MTVTLKFTPVTEKSRGEFHRLMQMYAAELDAHQHRSTNTDMLTRWTDSMIAQQKDNGRCLALCMSEENIVGFLYGRIDQPDDKGYKRIGHGYIMEFYVLPDHRRKGVGKNMLTFLESYFAEKGAHQLYLTADPVTGKPFWEAMGYSATGMISPEN